MLAATSGWNSSRSTKSFSTARRNASDKTSVSCSGIERNVPSGRKPPSVTSAWTWGFQLSNEPCVWMESTTPTDTSSPIATAPAQVLPAVLDAALLVPLGDGTELRHEAVVKPERLELAAHHS